jgi:eukaryotic-like serine/threonine-protein kinase
MAPSPGTRAGPYDILALLGSGGMGEVYKARDTRLGRTVAIKFLKSAHTDRLDREARGIAALNHPHICTIHDVGPDYLVMEYLEGAPLGSPVPLENAIWRCRSPRRSRRRTPRASLIGISSREIFS